MKSFNFISRQLAPVGLIVLLLVVSGAAQDPQRRSLPFPDAKGGPGDVAQGDLWMRWSTDRRLGFVQGFLEGSRSAYVLACGNAESLAPSVPNLNSDCLAQFPPAPLKASEYVRLVTDFYSKYPRDRQLTIRRLIIKLSEPDMTVVGVHKWLDEIVKERERPHD